MKMERVCSSEVLVLQTTWCQTQKTKISTYTNTTAKASNLGSTVSHSDFGLLVVAYFRILRYRQLLLNPCLEFPNISPNQLKLCIIETVETARLS
jgi:hypothetical protein